MEIADTNKPLIDSYDDSGALMGRGITQQELIAGMQSGKYNSTAQLGPIDGVRLLGGGKVEATHAVIKDPSAKVELTQEMSDDFAQSHVQGFPKGIKIGANTMVPGSLVARANEQKTMFQLAQSRHDEVTQALTQSDDPKVKALAAQVPSIGDLLDDPKTSPGLTTALTRFQSYVSHADISHGGRDLYESLQAMAAPSVPDPNNKGKFIPNRDAPFAAQVMQAFGGKDVLEAYHNEVAPLELHTEGDAADMLASNPPGSRPAKYAQRFLNTLNSQKAAQYAAEEKIRQAAVDAKNTSDTISQPDALGFTPNVPGGLKEYDKRQSSFKKNADALAQTEGTYGQFRSFLNDVNAGKDLTGAQSVVALFDSIGLSATPLKGAGFRVNSNVIDEHAQARGWLGSLQQKLLGAKNGDIITPNQLKDYASIATQARQSQYVNLANEVHNAGLGADFVLPTGNGQHIDPATAAIFLQLAGGDPAKARQAATRKGWNF